MTAAATPVLVLEEVVKTYPGSPPVPALRGVGMRVTAGEMLAIVGQSGSGKTTLLNLAGALDRPTSGSVRVDGHDVTELPDASLSGLRGHHIGFVFQHFVLIETLTAAANVALGLLYRGVSSTTRRTRALDALDRVGLRHRARHRPGQLSGGEQQRVAIARALVGGPSILLADEPTGNLDTATGEQLLALLRDLNRDGTTIAVVTHDTRLAAALPRTVSLRDGLVESDSTASSNL